METVSARAALSTGPNLGPNLLHAIYLYALPPIDLVCQVGSKSRRRERPRDRIPIPPLYGATDTDRVKVDPLSEVQQSVRRLAPLRGKLLQQTPKKCRSPSGLLPTLPDPELVLTLAVY